jgi:pimeloyl-ACP methyl ester carboxylesterase
MATYQRGDTSIYYEEHGTGFPLLLLAPGGMNSTIDFWGRMPINPIDEFKNEFRVVAMDQRNAGRSSGPLPLVDPWGDHVADQLGLMDHLGIDRFLVIGCCIGCSYILKQIELAPQRVLAGILMQPIGLDHTNPGSFAPRIYKDWGADLVEKRSDITSDMIETFGQAMWSGDFVFTVTREFLKTVDTPLLVLPGVDMAHPTGIGLEVAELLPNGELHQPWRDPPEAVPGTVARMRQFLQSHAPAAVA